MGSNLKISFRLDQSEVQCSSIHSGEKVTGLNHCRVGLVCERSNCSKLTDKTKNKTEKNKIWFNRKKESRFNRKNKKKKNMNKDLRSVFNTGL